ncbi:heteromeric transposase endonuclease subunit TnsA [Endozoicomonas sp. OPT23]|uniref:TnsA endonuclease N-terminal domain-containing protein n=1 Tax=Endozoicomonas sp. OPT23 TaxID=2072845 RepID=UPI00129B02F3|nr:TnsA endonuclease N-terminal domain-containing protein [Endozoicomonas sp. OPT23]MRI31374.1 heteromeric transposase endonuclease subunit TnsA [Endozoicomonas sp. OPT23]
MGRRRKLESVEDYKRALKNGFGLGDGDDYKPWIRAQDVPSKGKSSKIQGMKSNRIHHCLSQGETSFFYLAEFSDAVTEIREQFPLLPLSLSHKIAKAFEIAHPRVPKGEKELSVLTTDFLLTINCGENASYLAVSVKPEGELEDERVLEKQELERIWWNLLGIPFKIYTQTEDTKIQAKNIAWISDPLRYGFTTTEDELFKAAELFSKGDTPFKEAVDYVASNTGISLIRAIDIVKTLIYKNIISVDFSVDIEDSGLLRVIGVYEAEYERKNVVNYK